MEKTFKASDVPKDNLAVLMVLLPLLWFAGLAVVLAAFNSVR